MTRHEYFRLFLNKALYKKAAWVFPLFSIVTDPDQASRARYKNVPKHLEVMEDNSYKLVYTTLGYGYISPEDQETILPISDAVLGEPLLNAKEKITLQPGDLPSVKEPVETTVGRAFLNAVLFATTVGDKIPYLNKKFSPGNAEELVLDKLEDTPKDPADRQPGVIYVDEYLDFCNAAFYLRTFSQLFVPGATFKTMTAPPNNAELKAKLLEKYKDRLTDPAVVATIQAELQKNDAEYLKGDLGEGFLITAKSRNIVRTKKFLMYGAEPGLEEKVEVDTITNSLEEGWDVNRFPAMNNALRAGSFNRGAQTMLGGESVKWLLRASSNIAVTQDDCGTKLGMPVELTEANIKKYRNFTVIVDGRNVVVTDENKAELLGKKVMARSPMFCQLDKTDYCRACVGPRLSLNPTAISSAVSGQGSTFMLLYMKAAHAKGLSLAKMNIDEAIF